MLATFDKREMVLKADCVQRQSFFPVGDKLILIDGMRGGNRPELLQGRNAHENTSLEPVPQVRGA